MSASRAFAVTATIQGCMVGPTLSLIAPLLLLLLLLLLPPQLPVPIPPVPLVVLFFWKFKEEIGSEVKVSKAVLDLPPPPPLPPLPPPRPLSKLLSLMLLPLEFPPLLAPNTPLLEPSPVEKESCDCCCCC